MMEKKSQFVAHGNPASIAALRIERVPTRLYAYLALVLAERGKPSQASVALCSAIKESIDSGEIETSQGWEDVQASAPLMAKNWLEGNPKWGGPAVGKLFDIHGRIAQAEIRFGMNAWHFSGDKAKEHALALMKGQELPGLNKEEKEACAHQHIELKYPASFSTDVQRAHRLSAAECAQAEKSKKWACRFAELFDAASAEWRLAGLARPKSNPFEKIAAGWAKGRWEPVEMESEKLLTGSFWIAAIDSHDGLFFLSANGSKMRDISRGRAFPTKEESLGWGSRFGATAAIELSWTPASFAAADPRQANESLSALFSCKEAKEVGEAIGPAKEVAKKRRSASL